jgi:hypothetical protein
MNKSNENICNNALPNNNNTSDSTNDYIPYKNDSSKHFTSGKDSTEILYDRNVLSKSNHRTKLSTNQLFTSDYATESTQSICNALPNKNPSDSTDYNILYKSDYPECLNPTTKKETSELNHHSNDISKLNHGTDLLINQLSNNDYANEFTHGKPPKSNSDNTLYNPSNDNPSKRLNEHSATENPSNSNQTDALFQSKYHNALSRMISDMPAFLFFLPQNNPVSQLYLFNLFPDHPG